MIKLLLGALVVGGIFLVTPAGQAFKTSVIEVVNPVAHEKEKLSGLEEYLDTMVKTVSQPKFQNLSDSEKTREIKTMLSQADALLEDAQETAEDLDLLATLSSMLKKSLPDSWFLDDSCEL